MEAPKNTPSKFLGDTATAPVDAPKFQQAQSVRKVVNVSEEGRKPSPQGVQTPGPND